MEEKPQKQEKLQRITVYLTKKEKRDAQIAAAHADLNMATLGRRAIQYLIYAPTPEEISDAQSKSFVTEEEIAAAEAGTSAGTD